MADVVNRETRSRVMSAVRSKNTKLELDVRRRLYAQGFRYRLHRKGLPGTPDMVFAKYRAVVFVHGCFWHYHRCHLSKLPGTRQSWWKQKLEANKARDAKVVSELQKLGWRVMTVWECSIRKPRADRKSVLDDVTRAVDEFLKSETVLAEIP